jgi:hypothetical protein
MHHRFESCVVHVSPSEALHAGERLGSGTVEQLELEHEEG